MKNILEQAQNKINIVGKLLDVNIGEGVLNDGRKYMRATANIRVTQTYCGKEETSEIPVSLFAAQYTTTNKLNPMYQGVIDLANLKTAQNVGYDKADTVYIRNGNIRENNYVTKSGQVINTWQINTGFVNTTTLSESASFIVDIFIMDMHDELDRDGDSTGRLVIKGGIVQYNGKLDVIEFIVEQPDHVDYISRNWNINDTVTVRGRIRITSKEEKQSGNASSWGEDVPEATTRIVRELIITKGDDEGKDEEFAYDPTDIKKAFNVRKAAIEQKQVDAKNVKPASKAAPTANKYSWE